MNVGTVVTVVWVLFILRMLVSLRMALAVLHEVHEHNVRRINAYQFDDTIDYDTLPGFGKFVFDLTLWTRAQAIRRYADPLTVMA